ncbi:MAG: NADH-quinone oxidoreductase subunit H [Anaerotruncus sp.]|nr:NADH-quinone oxidoreductase subunit H [Anaerotruncus sp.]
MLFGYEVPLFLAVLGPAILADSWRLAEIAAFYQARPLLLLANLPGFLVALVAVQAKLERTPFDIPHAETEIVGGTFTEYSGKKLALFRLTFDIELVVASGLLAAVFLGGFPGGAVVGFLHFVVKTLFIIFLLSPPPGPDLADPRRPGRLLRLEGPGPAGRPAAPGHHPAEGIPAMKIAVFLPELLRHFFKKPATVDYPFKKTAVPKDFRGTPFLNPDMCIVCKACERDCPAEAIEITDVDPAAKRFRMVIHNDRCIHCAQCVDSCPTNPKAMQMDRPVRDRHGRPPQAENGLGLRAGRAQAQGAGRLRRPAAPAELKSLISSASEPSSGPDEALSNLHRHEDVEVGDGVLAFRLDEDGAVLVLDLEDDLLRSPRP